MGVLCVGTNFSVNALYCCKVCIRVHRFRLLHVCARFGSSKSCTVGTVCTLIGQVDETAGVRSTNHEGFVVCFAKPALLGVEVEVSFAYLLQPQ